jgi:hypothetical protein
MKRAWAVFLAVEAAATAAAQGDALAHGPDDERVLRPAPSASSSPAPGAETTAPPAGAEQGSVAVAEQGEAEERARVGVDLVLGWGRVPFALQNLPTTGTQSITYSRAVVPSDVQSLIVGGSVVVAPRLDVGARLPLTFGTVSPGGSAARSATSLGNIELGGEYVAPLSDLLELGGAFGVALPTAQGDEIPEDLNGVDARLINFQSLDRFSVARAAAAARGYEDNALFEPKRVGLVPRIALSYRGRFWTFEPYVKVENLIGTSSALDAAYVGELVGVLRVAYRVLPAIELAVRAWANVGFAGTDEDKRTTAAVEPDIALSSGLLRAYAGMLVPLAGPPEEAGFLGVRLGLTGTF